MKCPTCGSDNLEGSAYCEDCGSRLAMTPAAPVMAAPAPVVAAPAPVGIPSEEMPAAPSQPVVDAVPSYAAPSVEMPAEAINESGIVCAACGAVNGAGSMFCEDCGASLAAAPAPVEVPMAPIPAPVAAPVAAPAPVQVAGLVSRPRLVVAGGQVEFPLDRDSMLLGRNSPADNIFPEIDLTNVDTESYISRRHGRITRQDGAFLYEDIGSSNGSFVNGNKLMPKTVIELHDGDTLRLGRTEMCFRV